MGTGKYKHMEAISVLLYGVHSFSAEKVFLGDLSSANHMIHIDSQITNLMGTMMVDPELRCPDSSEFAPDDTITSALLHKGQK